MLPLRDEPHDARVDRLCTARAASVGARAAAEAPPPFGSALSSASPRSVLTRWLPHSTTATFVIHGGRRSLQTSHISIAASTMSASPPMPEPMAQPIRAAFGSVTSNPESLKAWIPATMPY